MVIRNFKYTAEDVDCQSCTEFRHGRCRAQKCPWLKERIEAGVQEHGIKGILTIHYTMNPRRLGVRFWREI